MTEKKLIKPAAPKAVKPATQDERARALAAAMAQIEKQFGKGAIMRLGDDRSLDVALQPTGIMGLDIATGGGLPYGRICEIYGPEASGKTTLALYAIAAAQRAGRQCAFIDAEHALDPKRAAALGVDTDSLLISQPDTGEQALEITDALVRSGAVSVIVVDSVAALVPKAEIEGEIGDAHVGLQARMMSQAMRKLKGNIGTSQALVIFINQLRMKIGVMFGNPETTTGGNALKFYASVRLDVRAFGNIKEGDAVIGKDIRVKVVKNKVAPPFRQAEFRLLFGQGVDFSGNVLDLAVDAKIVTKTGAWYAYGNDKLGNGRKAAVEYLGATPALLADITDRVRAHYLSPDRPALPAHTPSPSVSGTDAEDDFNPEND
ncbi:MULTISPECIES: recombinase RecA [unclassified Pantoea]|uniref:recombinase RecA n=1 Tax=Pantoea TaxID=53335 RepID=UPI001231ABE7|nr:MULTISPECIES: recombinase RecA [Pantoea]KAA6093624.1 recombinase RecA [Pantoea sp. B_9]KAA6105717.1 recombinase RecA [Pantoea sp. B_10]KAA8669090.1 recombinase RecA [Pantoea dispersa]